jgi:hypothetical protein
VSPPGLVPLIEASDRRDVDFDVDVADPDPQEDLGARRTRPRLEQWILGLRAHRLSGPRIAHRTGDRARPQSATCCAATGWGGCPA